MATAKYGATICAQQPHPPIARRRRRARRGYLRPPLPPQTRAALLAELRAAVADDDRDKVLDIELAAFAEDRAHPDQPRLMDEVRQIVPSVKAVA